MHSAAAHHCMTHDLLAGSMAGHSTSMVLGVFAPFKVTVKASPRELGEVALLFISQLGGLPTVYFCIAAFVTCNTVIIPISIKIYMIRPTLTLGCGMSISHPSILDGVEMYISSLAR